MINMPDLQIVDQVYFLSSTKKILTNKNTYDKTIKHIKIQ